jgi:hypothetical protein
MTGVFLVRGIWGKVHARWRDASQADIRIEALGDLPRALADYRPQAR